MVWQPWYWHDAHVRLVTLLVILATGGWWQLRRFALQLAEAERWFTRLQAQHDGLSVRHNFLAGQMQVWNDWWDENDWERDY